MDVVSYSELRQHLKRYMDTAADRHERLIISRPSGQHMVMMSLKDYEAERETQYLLGSEANRAWLQASIADLKAGNVVFHDLIDTDEDEV